MKKILCLFAVVALLITALPSCSQKITAEGLYTGAAEALLQAGSGSVRATTTVTAKDQAGTTQGNTIRVTDYSFYGDNFSICYGTKNGENIDTQFDYTYLDGVLYMDKGVSGNEKWKHECKKEDISTVSGISIDMEFTRILPELSKDDFKDVEVLTDGQSRMITLSVPQSKLTYWMSAISGVENVEESNEKYEMKLVFDAQNNISKVYMRFQLFMDGVTLTVDLELSYSDIGANKPIELTSSEASYKELSISK